jgi:WD40 repeat protein/serine/threonine protein kinase
MNPLLACLHKLERETSLERQTELLDAFHRDHPELYDQLLSMYQKATAPSAAPPPSSSPRGRVLGDYVLEEMPIGSGAMGTVHRAEQRSLHRLVAVKLLKAGIFASRAARSAFQKEASRAGQLSHPAIVPIIEASSEDDEECFYAMRLIPGRSLKQALEGSTFEPVGAARLVQRLAEAVHSAHEQGVIHCDIKPGNVLLDDAGRAWLTDFGVARQLGVEQRQALGGTPEYMAPEQQEGQARAIGPATDVYALGLLLTELLCGKVLRQGPTGEVPRNLRAICRACLRHGPVRYASAAELADDLGRYLDHREVSARPAPLHEQFGRWAYRRPGIAALAGLLLAALVTIVVVLAVSNSQIRGYASELQKTNEDLDESGKQLKQASENLTRALDTSTRNERLARERAIKGYTRTGLALLDAGEELSALPYFAAGLRGERGDREAEAPHRMRIAWTLQFLPRPVQVVALDSVAPTAEFSADGTRFVSVTRNQARVWDAATDSAVTEPLEHSLEVTQATFSPDGTHVLTAGWFAGVRVWDARTGKVVRELDHTAPVNRFEFSPDARKVVGSGTGSAIVWDLATGRTLLRLNHQTDRRVNSALFSRKGDLLVTASEDRTACVWDARTGRRVVEIPHPEGVQHADFDPTGSRVVTAGGLLARVWDARTGKPLHSEPARHERGIRTAWFAPDGTWFFTRTNDDRVRTWDAQAGGPISRPGAVSNLAYQEVIQSPDRRRVLWRQRDSTVRIYDSATGRDAPVVLEHAGTVWSAFFDAAGRRLATVSFDNTARIWDSETGKALTPPLRHNDTVFHAAFSPNGQYLATASSDTKVRLWDAGTGELLRMYPHGGIVNHVAFSPDGQWLVAASDDRHARIWQTQRWLSADLPLPHREPVNVARFSPDGKTILTASTDGTARLWDFASRQPLGLPMRHNLALLQAWFSPDGQRIVTASRDHTARVWDARTGQPLAPPLRHTGAVRSAVFSPNGKHVLTTSEDRTAQVWDAASGKALTPPMQHRSDINHASFSPDGRWIATASADMTARLWSALTGEAVTAEMQHGEGVGTATFSPDGRRLATTSADGRARVWAIPVVEDRSVKQLIRLAEVLAGARIDERGVVVPLVANEVRDDWQDLRKRRPADFLARPEQVRRFHLGELEEAERSREWRAAGIHVDRLLALSPGNTALLARSGQARLAAGDARRALADFDAALKQNPRAPDLHTGRAQALSRLHDWARAIRSYTEALERWPAGRHAEGRLAALEERAWSYAEVTAWDKATVDWKAALASGIRHERFWLYRALASLAPRAKKQPAEKYASVCQEAMDVFGATALAVRLRLGGFPTKRKGLRMKG